MARDRNRKGWLSSLLGGKEDPPGTRYELTVLEGADAGCTFAIDRPQIQIGRRVPGTVNTGGIELNDRSVSGRHAIVGVEDGRVEIEHLPSATNATLVNGKKVTRRRRLRDGDRVVLGLVVLEVRALLPAQDAAPRALSSDPGGLAGRVATDPVNSRAELVLKEGVEGLAGARFPLIQRRTSLGRDDDCDIVLEVPAVSRHHAALVWEDEQLVLIHESAVNPTHVNGMQVRDRRRVFQGDEIRLSDRVVFDVMLETSEARAAAPAAGPGATDEEPTRLTSPPAFDPAAEEEATRVTPLPASGDGDDAEATRITRLDAEPERESAGDRPIEPTRVIPPEETVLDEGETPGRGDDGDAGVTRVAPVPAADAPGGVDPSAFASGEVTRIAPVPDRSRYADGEKTRIAPVPGAAPAPASGAASGDAGESGDADATLVRPAPTPADATRVANLDEQLRDETDPRDDERTVVRPDPAATPPLDPDDAAATIVRPRPDPAPAETVILEPEEEDD